ncbi:hypothetical protein LQW54_007276 [Pestalotiopsis sp. IQ-011]
MYSHERRAVESHLNSHSSGNIWDIRTNAAEKYRQWAKSYDGVFQIQLGNIPVVVVNTAATAKAIFGQNSQALASRPEFYTFLVWPIDSSTRKLVSDTSGTTIGSSPYSESLKRRRKGAASALNRPSVATYVQHLDVESKDFISELYTYGKAGNEPVYPMPMIQRLSLSLALTLNWGTRMGSQKEDLFHEITHVEEEISRFRSTTGNLQDYIPLLRILPFNTHSAKAKEMRKFYGDDKPVCDSENDQQCAYIVALDRESLRYYTVLRLALPKCSIRDVVYNGVTIPKGTVVFLNSWACNMDDETWSDPEVFRPERYLDRPEAPMFTYGMGYRMCAGSLLANRELYLVYMRLLNSFRVEKDDEIDSHPLTGNSDPTSLVAIRIAIAPFSCLATRRHCRQL